MDVIDEGPTHRVGIFEHRAWQINIRLGEARYECTAVQKSSALTYPCRIVDGERGEPHADTDANVMGA